MSSIADCGNSRFGRAASIGAGGRRGTDLVRRVHVWLVSIRDGFIALLPLTFLRVLAVLAESFPLPAYQHLMARVFGGGWQSSLDQAIVAFMGIYGVGLAAMVAVQLSERLPPSAHGHGREPPLMIAVSAIVNFVLVSAVVDRGTVNFGFGSMLMGIVVGLASAELLRRVAHWRMLGFVRLPYDTEATLYHALRLSPAMILVGLSMFAAAHLWTLLPAFPLHLLAPLVVWAQAHGIGVWVLSVVAALFNQVAWFIGIHGGLAMDAYASVDLFGRVGAPYASTLAWRPMFDGFILLGGSGATLGLLVAIAIATRDGAQREIARLALIPSLFNINDILLYGLPLVLNPVYLLPFVGVPVLLTLLVVGAAQLGVIHMQGTTFAWTTPALLSGWMLTGSWRGVALQLVEVGIGTLCYLPFVRRAELEVRDGRSRLFDSATRTILKNGIPARSASLWQDQVRLIARGLLDDLRFALAQGGLSLAYQPQHDRHGRAVGAEALLRWNHPRYGAVSPAVAVKLAEEGQDMTRLGAWVLETACAAKARWNAAGLRGLTMAVNVSPVQLTDPVLVRHVDHCLRKYGLSPEEVELEITESVALPDGQVVDQVLGELERTGVRLAIDDFGMGASSLLYLKRFNVHAIKIDGSLTRDLLDNATNADIIRTIVTLGQARHVHVVAEFVETAEQCRALAAMGCDTFQGYLYSPPIDEAACIAYLASHANRDPAAADPPTNAVADDRGGDEQLLDLVLEAAGFDLWENDLASGCITRKVSRILPELGYTGPEFASTIDDVFTIVHPDDTAALRHALQAHVSGAAAQYRAEFRIRARSGEWIWYANYGKIVDRTDTSPGRRLVGVTFNIDARKRREQELEQLNAQLSGQNAQLEAMNARLQELATSDPLTGIANRRKLLELGESEVQRAQRQGHPLSLLIIDIDDFKSVNDTWGHPGGDELIRAIARICAQGVRATVDIAGRIGGEEFAIVLPEVDGDAATALAGRLRAAIRDRQVVVDGGASVSRTVSIGVASLAPDCSSFMRLLAQADRALYAAKKQGKDCVCVASSAAGTPGS